jgi:hypothetical protein
MITALLVVLIGTALCIGAAAWSRDRAIRQQAQARVAPPRDVTSELPRILKRSMKSPTNRMASETKDPDA